MRNQIHQKPSDRLRWIRARSDSTHVSHFTLHTATSVTATLSIGCSMSLSARGDNLSVLFLLDGFVDDSHSAAQQHINMTMYQTTKMMFPSIVCVFQPQSLSHTIDIDRTDNREEESRKNGPGLGLPRG